MTPSERANRQFWVMRRQEAPKARTRLSVAEFVAEANRRLAADTACVPGTRFVVVPAPDARDQPSWDGPAAMRPLVQRIVQDMTTRFDLDAPFRIDR